LFSILLSVAINLPLVRRPTEELGCTHLLQNANAKTEDGRGNPLAVCQTPLHNLGRKHKNKDDCE